MERKSRPRQLTPAFRTPPINFFISIVCDCTIYSPKERRMKLLMVALTASFLFSNSVFAKSQTACTAAQAVVDKFISLDRSGETTHASKKIDALVETTGKDTPAWDSFALTKHSVIK